MPGPRRLAVLPSGAGRVAGAGAGLLLCLAGCSPAPQGQPATTGSTSPRSSAASSPATSPTPSAPTGTATSSTSTAARVRASLSGPADVTTGLGVPWSAVVLPDGSVLVSERDTATIRQVSTDGRTRTLGTVPVVVPNGEGGLLGLAVDARSYARNPVIYAYFTTQSDNRVARIPVDGQGLLGAPTPILTGIPRATNHNGGRLAFGPDGYLYVTTGDANNRPNAQNLASLGGKILRVSADGAAAPGNPFPGSPVWTYGHRNVQGIAWDGSGRMWASEFGQDTWDELNVITPGSNYGWPVVEGAAARSGFVDPVRQWRTSESSPSGIAVGPDGSIFIAALKGESLWKVPVNGDGSTDTPQRLLQSDFGRLRDVLVGPDGNLWIVTNNTARGTLRAGDDRIVRLPQSLTG